MRLCHVDALLVDDRNMLLKEKDSPALCNGAAPNTWLICRINGSCRLHLVDCWSDTATCARLPRQGLRDDRNSLAGIPEAVVLTSISKVRSGDDDRTSRQLAFVSRNFIQKPTKSQRALQFENNSENLAVTRTRFKSANPVHEPTKWQRDVRCRQQIVCRLTVLTTAL